MVLNILLFAMVYSSFNKFTLLDMPIKSFHRLKIYIALIFTYRYNSLFVVDVGCVY